MEHLRPSTGEMPADSTVMKRCDQYGDVYWALISQLLNVPLDVPNIVFSPEASISDKNRLLNDIHKIRQCVMQIRVLQHAFHHSPKRSIQGEKGVSKQINISKNGVYQRIDLLGLQPDDLREPSVSLDELVRRSSILSALIASVDRSIAEMTMTA